MVGGGEERNTTAMNAKHCKILYGPINHIRRKRSRAAEDVTGDSAFRFVIMKIIVAIRTPLLREWSYTLSSSFLSLFFVLLHFLLLGLFSLLYRTDCVSPVPSNLPRFIYRPVARYWQQNGRYQGANWRNFIKFQQMQNFHMFNNQKYNKLNHNQSQSVCSYTFYIFMFDYIQI